MIVCVCVCVCVCVRAYTGGAKSFLEHRLIKSKKTASS